MAAVREHELHVRDELIDRRVARLSKRHAHAQAHTEREGGGEGGREGMQINAATSADMHATSRGVERAQAICCV